MNNSGYLIEIILYFCIKFKRFLISYKIKKNKHVLITIINYYNILFVKKINWVFLMWNKHLINQIILFHNINKWWNIVIMSVCTYLL